MTRITQLAQLDMDARYSYADYLTWQLDEAVELIKGKIQLMSPAPSLKHQGISRNLLVSIALYLKGKSCQVFNAPFDVRLYDRKKSLLANADVFTVVQPDICVICEREKLDERGCNGAPDWIIEILSQGNSKRDIQAKFALYQESGVKEYWTVYPYEKVVQQFVLDDTSGRYQLRNMFADDDQASPSLFPELALDLREIFADDLNQ